MKEFYKWYKATSKSNPALRQSMYFSLGLTALNIALTAVNIASWFF